LPAQGVHPKVVQERLGHAQISLTLDTYSHVLPSTQADAANRLDAMLVAAPLVENGGKLAVNAG
jgi:integrase